MSTLQYFHFRVSYSNTGFSCAYRLWWQIEWSLHQQWQITNVHVNNGQSQDFVLIIKFYAFSLVWDQRLVPGYDSQWQVCRYMWIIKHEIYSLMSSDFLQDLYLSSLSSYSHFLWRLRLLSHDLFTSFRI